MKKGLGKGLEALFSIYDEEVEKTENKNEIKKKDTQVTTQVSGVTEISINEIEPNPNQPRKIFDEEALKELSNSIKNHGVIQPLVVNKTDDGYMIIAGERRWRASKLAGLDTVPCVVKNYTEKQIKEIALIENLQREDLNPIESAKAIHSLIEEFNLTQDEVADKLGKSRPAVANTLRLLTLPEEVIKYIEEGKLSAGHARTLLGLDNDNQIIEIAKYVIEKKLSVRDLEVLVKNLNKPKKEKVKQEQSLELKDFANTLNKMFSTKVSILGNDKKGRIYIDYYSADDLQRIYDILNR